MASIGVDVGALWNRILQIVADKPQQAAVVDMFEFKSLASGIAKLAISPRASRSVAQAKSGWMGELLSKAVGAPVRVEVEEDFGAPRPNHNGPSAPEQSARRTPDAEAALRRQAMEQPLVKRAVELFNARIISIEDDA